MHLTHTRLLPGLALAALALIAPAVQAVPLTNWNNHLIGNYTPTSPTFAGDAQTVVGANTLINWYNGGPNPNGGAVTFTLTVGASVPPPPLPPAVFGARDEPPFGTVNPADTSYVLGKYGQASYLFFLGNVDAGAYTVPLLMGGHDLSNFVTFSASRQVPDGGATLALLGGAMLLLEGVRRRLRLA